MNLRGTRSVPPRTSRAAFTLVEVVLAITIVATVFVALIGLLPAGMAASRSATDATRVGTLLEDVQTRLRGEKLQNGPASFSPAYYDAEGIYLSSLDGTAKPFYRAEVAFGQWVPPINTSGLQPVTVAIYWPVDAQGGIAPPRRRPGSASPFRAAPLTGPSWTAIDSSYVPKIEL